MGPSGPRVRSSPFDGDEPILMAIVGEGGEASAREAILGGADIVQVRAKHLNAKELTRLVRGVIEAVGSAERIVVNSRPDIAELTHCLGVHLSETGLDSASVRAAFPALLIGVSRHDNQALRAMQNDGADYVLLGPVLATPEKEEHAIGLTRFQTLASGIPIPVIAVGGLDPENAMSVWEAGARGFAAIRAFRDHRTARASAASFKLHFKYSPEADLS